MSEEIREGKYEISKNGLRKFIFLSLIGFILFLFPIKDGTTFNIPIGVVADYLLETFNVQLPIINTYILIIASFLCLISLFFKPRFIMKSALLNSLFNPSLFGIVLRLLGTVFAFMTLYNFGPEIIISEETGGEILNLLNTLIIWFLVTAFIIPLIINFGIMEFTGTLLRKIVKPLFTLPGRSAIDLLVSWIGSPNVGVVLTREQYENGFYTGREAAVIATNFSAVSLPFALVVSEVLEVTHMFPVLYLSVVIVGIICAVIIPRTPPSSKITDTFYTENLYTEEVPENRTAIRWATEQAVKKAENAGSVKVQIKEGFDIFAGIAFTLLPQVMAIGTVALILAKFTPIFSIVAFPMIYILKFLQIPEASAVAPATLIGFIDMFLPAILSGEIKSEMTRFFIGALSISQIIYITEMGTLILVSKIPINLWKLFIIFLQRTMIAIVIIALITHLLY